MIKNNFKKSKSSEDMDEDSKCESEPDENVTKTFNRSQKYYRVLRRNEWKYRIGLNCDDGSHDESKLYWPIQVDEYEGGFYFTNEQNIVKYVEWGERICEVTVPASAIIYKFDDYLTIFEGPHSIWRASEIILSEPILVSVFLATN